MPSIISSAAVASLALGIGGALAMFTLVNSVLLRPLAVDRPHELATLSTVAAAQDRRTEMFSYATFEDIRRRGLFDGVFTWTLSSVNVESESQPVSAMWVTGDAFQILGVRASIGRSLAPEDDAAGGGRDGPVAMISHRLWQRRFNRSPAVIGSSLMVERTPVTIVGVTPPDFHGVELGRPFDLFLPMQTGALIEPAQVLGPHDPYLWIMLRLARGQSLDAATAALRTSQAAIRLGSLPPRVSAAEYLQDPFTLESASGGTSVYSLRQQYSTPLLMLLALATIVLVVACANVANLLLGRGTTRRTEMAIRLALGASRWGLARRLLLESLALATAGAALGLVFAAWASRALVALMPVDDLPLTLDLSLDWRMVAFTIGLTMASSAFFGVAPALHATRVKAFDALKNARGDQRGRGRALNVFLIAQVAMSLVLVLTAGLFVRTFQQLTNVPLGFESNGLLLGIFDASTVPTAARTTLYDRLLDAVTGVPGVRHAGLSIGGPLTRFGTTGIQLLVSGARELPDSETLSQAVNITPGWLDAYGMRLRSGRDVAATDTRGSLPVILVNETFARRFFPDEDLLGRTISLAGRVDGQTFPLGPKTIVGIVADSVYNSIREPAAPTFYEPIAQRAASFFPFFSVAIRPTAESPAQMSGRVRAAIARVDADLKTTLRPMADRVSAALARDRLVARLSLCAGVVALVLAVIGLYGVTAYRVARRRPELGIRMAIGSTPGAVLRLVLLETVRVVGVGILLGVTMSLWSGQIIASLLYGVTPREPLIIAGATIVMLVAGLVSAYGPAYRASVTDPVTVLRHT
jgi:putative ABC transport system permease protein